MPGGGRRERRLTADELALWRGVTRDARPLKAIELEDPAPVPEPPPAEPERPAVAPTPARDRLHGSHLPAQPGPRLDPDRPVGLDRRSWQRLKEGRLPIQARLDLHGDTQEVAHRRLERFLEAAQVRGLRCVLVVTGKGRGGGGILRHVVPRWLNEAHNRDRLVAYTPAQRHHGGAGALYLLIRRSRGQG